MNELREYYDKNTKQFLSMGLGSGNGAIHRALWAPGVTTRAAAMNYVNELIAGEIRRSQSEHGTEDPLWLDLGCGVGGTIDYLNGRVPARFLGVTVSPVQKSLADRRFAAVESEPRPEVVVGDFCDPALYGETLAGEAPAGAYMVESFLHAHDPGALFRHVGRAMRRGGSLAICDDFLTAVGLDRLDAATPLARRQRLERRSLDEFRRGWQAGSLLTVAAAEELAAEGGFSLERNFDLSSYVELGRPRDRLIRLAVELGRPFRPRGTRWSSIMGGNALQQCLKLGLVRYRFLVFRKRA